MPASWTTAPSREDLCVPWKGHERPHPDSDTPRMTMAPPLTLLSGPHFSVLNKMLESGDICSFFRLRPPVILAKNGWRHLTVSLRNACPGPKSSQGVSINYRTRVSRPQPPQAGLTVQLLPVGSRANPVVVGRGYSKPCGSSASPQEDGVSSASRCKALLPEHPYGSVPTE